MRFVLLMVEGPHDVEFLGQLLSHAGYRRLRDKRDIAPFWINSIPTKYPMNEDLEEPMRTPVFYASNLVSIAIKSVGGINRLVPEAKRILGVIELPEAVGFFFDADTKTATQQHTELRERLSKETNINLPDTPGRVQAGDPRCGSYVFPDNTTPGTLEHVLVECAKIHYAGLFNQARKFIGDVNTNQLNADELRGLNKPQGRTKAALCCVASVLKPAQTIQASIRSDRWLTGEAQNLPLVSAAWVFVEQLIGDP